MPVLTQDVIHSLAEFLTARKAQLCTAESCTGGLIAKSLTDIAGSSNWFDRGFVTYSNQAKIDMLGVQADSILQQGAVSELVAKEMVQGAINNSGAQYAVAVTGIAGPGGGSDGKPVGTIWFGFSTPHQKMTEKLVISGDRAQIRTQASHYALNRLWQLILSKEF